MGVKKVYKIDSNGYYLDDVILKTDGEVPIDCVEIEMPNGLFSPRFVDGVWVNGISEQEIDVMMGRDLESIRKKKIEELNKKCNENILGRFPSVVNSVTYYFSNDTEAQINFDKADGAFYRNRIADVPWTAYDANGNVVRLLLTATTFEPVFLDHLSHIQNNISKLRDTLEPQVKNATTVAEIEAIVW